MFRVWVKIFATEDTEFTEKPLIIRHCERSAAILDDGINQLEIAASLRSSQ